MYFNGEPALVLGYVRHWVQDGQNCTEARAVAAFSGGSEVVLDAETQGRAAMELDIEEFAASFMAANPDFIPEPLV